MKEHKPEWYAQAKKGPFMNGKFTEVDADRVIHSLQRDGQQSMSRTGKRLRVQIIAVASFILLLGLGWLALDGDGTVATNHPQAAVSANITEAAMQQTAEDAMEEMLGKSIQFDRKEWLPEQRQIFFSYEKGTDSASIWISTETGELIQAKMNATLEPEEIDPVMSEQASAKWRELGFKGDSQFNIVNRYVEYGVNASPIARIQTSLNGDRIQVVFVNGIIDGVSSSLNLSEVSEEANLAGQRALELLRGKDSDELTAAFRAVRGDSDTVSLKYGLESSVSLDYATLEINQVSDITFFDGKETETKQLAEHDRKLLNIESDKLVSSAIPIVNSLFGIHLQDYTMTKNPKTPGSVTFYSGGEVPAINVSYNTKGVIWNVQRIMSVDH